MMQTQIVNFGNKHGQLKIQQMAFMLVAITLFFVLAGLFFFINTIFKFKTKCNRTRKTKYSITYYTTCKFSRVFM